MRDLGAGVAKSTALIPGTVVSVRNLSVRMTVSSGRAQHSTIRPVDDVSFDIPEAQTLGLVGESGCGKSTLGRAILMLQKPSAGQVWIAGKEWTALSPRELRRTRSRAQLIFQDPFGSFNPRRTIRDALVEAARLRIPDGPTAGRSAVECVEERVGSLLAMVELDSRLADRRPDQCSGGQLQRAAVARALAVGPQFLVADEPTSALDVSIQAQLMNLLTDVQEELRLAYLFISHNLAVIRQMSAYVGVMYLGQIVEIADSDQLFEEPLHPYTQALVSAVPVPDPERERNRQRIRLGGSVPSMLQPPSGCHFHPRCPLAMPICQTRGPKLLTRDDGRAVACHLYST